MEGSSVWNTIDTALKAVSRLMWMLLVAEVVSPYALLLSSVATHINEVQRLTDSMGDLLLQHIPDFYISAHIGIACSLLV